MSDATKMIEKINFFLFLFSFFFVKVVLLKKTVNLTVHIFKSNSRQGLLVIT